MLEVALKTQGIKSMDEITFSEAKSRDVIYADDHYTLREFSKKTASKTKVVLCRLGICLAFLVVGVGLGFWSCKLKKTSKARKSKPVFHYQDIATEINSKEIEKVLRELTQLPHNAGSKRNNQLAQYIKQKWQNEYGIKTKLIRYKVLLSFPSLTKRSSVRLLTPKGEVMFRTQATEKPVEVSEYQDDILPPFAAYSSSGNVTAGIIYVNYGRNEDFKHLVEQNISCKGKIVIARYGENFRGDKVNLAYTHGAVGVIIYSDPADYAPDPTAGTYPESEYLPCSGVQRGSFLIAHGDPATPGYPAKDGIYRLAKDKRKLTKIPVYPISACDAQEILGKLKKVIPRRDGWKGGLNISYNIGPGFEKPYDTWKVRLEVYNEEREQDIYNVIGTIEGKHEPDRRVMIGNHRDAWVFGGVDPSGGTACLMEIARTLGRALRNGWRPQRTIVLCSWGGEEYGMIGSTEYVEEFGKTLREESVAYLNIDSPVRGSYSLYAKSSPMLFDVLFQAAKKVKNPVNEETVYEQWVKNLPSTKGLCNLPRVDKIATGSDYVAFAQQLGVPSSEIRYIAGKDNLGYPVYHSLHDTFNYVKTFIDPEFLIHRSVAQVMIHSILSLADSKVLPMNASRYSEILTEGVKKISENYKTTLNKNSISLEYLEKAVETFILAADYLQKKVQAVDKQDDLKLRILNDKMISLEKGFIRDIGSAGTLEISHVIFGVNAINSYKTVEFPGLSNVLMLEPKNKAAIENQMNIIITQIRSVSSYLKDDD